MLAYSWGCKIGILQKRKKKKSDSACLSPTCCWGVGEGREEEMQKWSRGWAVAVEVVMVVSEH